MSRKRKHKVICEAVVNKTKMIWPFEKWPMKCAKTSEGDRQKTAEWRREEAQHWMRMIVISAAVEKQRMMWREGKKHPERNYMENKNSVGGAHSNDRMLRLNISALAIERQSYDPSVRPAMRRALRFTLPMKLCTLHIYFLFILFYFLFFFFYMGRKCLWCGIRCVYAKWVYWKMVIKAQPVFVRGFFVILSKTFGACEWVNAILCSISYHSRTQSTRIGCSPSDISNIFSVVSQIDVCSKWM